MSRRPEITPSLELVPEADRGLYLPLETGGFALHPGLVEFADDWAAERAEITAETEAARAQLEELETKMAVDKVFGSDAVRPEVSDAAAALFRGSFDIRRADGSVVVGPDRAELGFAVSAWLETDAGRPYRARPAHNAPGPLSAAMLALRPVQ